MSCNNTTCSPPKDVEFSIRIGDEVRADASVAPAGADPLSGVPVQKSGLLKFFLLSLLAGFAGILTPCVFPMIPMTVAFFSQGSENRTKSVVKALIFGFSIVLIYSLLGIIVSLTSAGAGFANALSTHWIPNILFFALFVLFAISFFGAFEIVLPNKWVSGADSRVDRGGLIASFFMGLTTVIVSFSCTGPIVGALLVEAASGDVLQANNWHVWFRSCICFAFYNVRTFPFGDEQDAKIGRMAKFSKGCTGFYNACFQHEIPDDYRQCLFFQDYYQGIFTLPSGLYCSHCMGLYLMGKIKFNHDSDLPYIGTFRLFLIIAVFSFVVYLIPGLFGAPLKGLSALLPSPQTSKFNLAGCQV